MNKQRRRIVFNTLGYLSALGVPAPFKPLGAQQKLTARVCTYALPSYADIGLSSNLNDNELFHRNLFEKLVEHSPTTGEYKLVLARNHQTSNGGTTHIFELLRRVSFHRAHGFVPSRYFNAQDVKHSLTRHADNSPEFIDKTLHQHRIDNTIKSLRILDEHRIAIDTYADSPDQLFALLASPCSVIVSAEYSEQLRRANRTQQGLAKPIATGPYYVADSMSNRALQLRRHERYRAPKGNVDIIEVLEVPNQIDRYTLLRTNRCHIVSSMSHRLLTPLARRKMLYNCNTRLQYILNLAIGSRGEPARIIPLKYALENAIDRFLLNNTHFGAQAKIVRSLINPCANVYPSEIVKRRPQKLRNAATIPLNEAPLELLITDAQSTGRVPTARLAFSIQQALRHAGIEVVIRECTHAEKMAAIKLDQFDLALFTLTPVDLQALGYITELGFRKKHSGVFDWKDDQLERLIEAFQRASPHEQTHWLAEIDQLTAERSPIMPLLNMPLIDGLSPAVRGFRRGQYGELDFRELTLS